MIFQLPGEFSMCPIGPKNVPFHSAPASETSLMPPTSLLSSEGGKIGDMEPCRNVILTKAQLPIIELSLSQILLSPTGNFLLPIDD